MQRVMALLLMAVLVLAGCGSDGSDESASGASAGAPGETSASSPSSSSDGSTAATGRFNPPDSSGAVPTSTASTGGCGALPDDIPANRLVARSIGTGDMARDYLVYVPDSYTGDEPSPVVYTLHGAGSNKEEQLGYSAFGSFAEDDGALIVAPDATGDPRRWSPWGAEPSVSLGGVDGVNDLEFFAELLDEIEATFCVDSERVYATGMSSGGYMSASIACALSDRIAAVGAVAATIWAEGACGESEPMPYVYFHGTEDPIVPFLGPVPGPNGEPGPGSAQVSAQHWADHNGCDPEPREERIGTEVVHQWWEGCEAPTELYIVEGGGHTWPGGIDVPRLGRTTKDISASEIIWDLFMASSR